MVTIPKPNPWTQLEHAAGVREGFDHGTHLVDAQAVLRHDPPHAALVRTLPRAHRSLKIGQVLLRHADSFGLVGDGDVDHTIFNLHIDGPDVLRSEHPEPAPLDHRGTAHAKV